jgi:hypothetical protein
MLREQSHRRAVLLGLAALLVLAMSPLFGHHLMFGLDRVLEGRDHLWALCLVALHILLGPVHSGFHALFIAGLAYAVWDRLRALRSVQVGLRAVATASPQAGGPIWKAAVATSLDPDRLRVVEGLPTPAFTAGWLRPRIYVAAALGCELTHDELAAVLAHEAAHVERRDPLRLSVLRFLGCTLFWIPALRRLAAEVADEGELRADDVAAEKHGLALASALVRLGTWKRPARVMGVGFTDGDLLERRVRRLTGDEFPLRSRLTRRSLIGAFVALMLAWSSGLAVAHPMPDHADGHCDRHSRAAVFHLFCRSDVHGALDYCPHGHVRS